MFFSSFFCKCHNSVTAFQLEMHINRLFLCSLTSQSVRQYNPNSFILTGLSCCTNTMVVLSHTHQLHTRGAMGDSILLKDTLIFELEDLWIEAQPSDE